MKFLIIGPCALESAAQLDPLLAFGKRWGVRYFRSQLYKPRTSPDYFQGLGVGGLDLVQTIQAQGFAPVSEACSLAQLEIVAQFAEIIQIGARNMQNFELLKQVGPVLARFQKKSFVMLKRGFANTLEEWILAARYLEEGGVMSSQIILVERGTRNHCAPSGVTLDFVLALKAKEQTNYAVIVDPSHGTRDRHYVLKIAQAALALGLDGQMLELHPWPHLSVSDAQQALSIDDMTVYFRDNYQSLGLRPPPFLSPPQFPACDLH